MKILEYTGFDSSSVAESYRKVATALAQGDFRAAQVKKLVNLTHGKFYRAKLDAANRLLFTFVRYGDEVCLLMLEVIMGHNYHKSRFLRGAPLEEEKIPDVDASEALNDAEQLRYLHPNHTEIHLLDKPISFDDAQQAVYLHKPPLIIVGSAGSGKTALMLEKLKHVEGEVLYVTHSQYLAQNARNIYYAYGFEHPAQEAHFLSYREFVESIRVPTGREATWRDFAAWFYRMRSNFKEIDPHQAFEEIRGVITAPEDGCLSRKNYLQLGVRQSIFSKEQRSILYDLFLKYRHWLTDSGLFDLNLIAHEWKASPRYDFVLIDEVQDMTVAQLSLVLKSLKKAGHFLLCGDSNQIVHPNFFAWSHVKTLFWKDPNLAGKKQLQVLTANFRNGREATRIANQLLKLKHQRFGSIDRESNFLVEAIGGAEGQAQLMADTDATKREFNKKISHSTRFAVLVMRDEEKQEARKYFSTPLLFSIHEAKGLEYDNIVLFRFVSSCRREFNDIAEGVSLTDLEAIDSLEYCRAKEKGDKSLEVYKFFINALYVALTRAVKNLYLIESDTKHRLFELLGLAVAGKVEVAAEESSLEEWQKEARKLELQGKQEQAEAIRRDILKEVPPPWQVCNETRLDELIHKVFKEKAPGNKFKQQLYEYATCHVEPVLAQALEKQTDYRSPHGSFWEHLDTIGRKSYLPYFSQQTKAILRQCEQHGPNHRLPMNQTPLMAAAAAGNIALTEALLERGADPTLNDHYGYNALHWAMRQAFRDNRFARTTFGTLYERLAPAAVDISSGERMIRLDRHLAEYLLFQTCWVLFKSRFTTLELNGEYPAFDTSLILEAWEHMPDNVVPTERKRRTYLSSVLARNEVSRNYAYNRSLFERLATGWYQFNPALHVRTSVTEEGQSPWIPIFQAVNLPLISKFCHSHTIATIVQCFRKACMAVIPELEAEIAQQQATKAAKEQHLQTLVKQVKKKITPSSDSLAAKLLKQHKLSKKLDDELLVPFLKFVREKELEEIRQQKMKKKLEREERQQIKAAEQAKRDEQVQQQLGFDF
uniref:Ankyrin n=1 Tax=Chlorobium chlorochromatii (strain CaD3) TaxID=340177 RepID=Q3APM8_CHLCH